MLTSSSSSSNSFSSMSRTMSSVSTIVLLTETIAAKGASIGVAVAALEVDKFGWVQVYGVAEGLVLASDAADALQYATTTAGSLDDAGTTTIHGAQLVDTVTGAGIATFFLSHPCTNA